MAIWVTSDLHLNHYNILKLEKYNLQKNGLGYIQTIEEYNNMIIDHINSLVKPNDTLYILGDFAFGKFSDVSPLVKRVNGHKILIMGNHDKYQPGQALGMGFEKVYQAPLYLPESNGRIIMCHYPVKEVFDNPYVAYCLHGHLHGSKLDLDKFINVNITMNGYYPLPMNDFLNHVESKCKSRRERWLEEWYAPYQVFEDKSRTDINLDSNGHIIL